MSNPTSNFNWQMPTASDLVTDLPADFEVFGQAVDTSLADLKGGTTGQVLSKATNADMDFTWVTTDDANAIQNSIVDAKGDLIAASANDTPARIGVGANGTVLTADSAETTGLKWAAPASGGMTLISTTTLSGASVTLSSIPQTYVHLQFIVVNMLPATDGSNLSLAINGDTGASRYFNKADGGNNATGSYGSSIAQITYDMDNAVTQGLIWGQIPYYTNATTWKFFQTQSLTNDNTTSANYRWSFYANGYNQTDAISSLKFQPNSGNFTSGTLYLYGVK